MLYREIITVYYESHTTHINTQCGQNIQFMNVETGGSPCLKLLMIQIAQLFSFSMGKKLRNQTVPKLEVNIFHIITKSLIQVSFNIFKI